MVGLLWVVKEILTATALAARIASLSIHSLPLTLYYTLAVGPERFDGINVADHSTYLGWESHLGLHS